MDDYNIARVSIDDNLNIILEEEYLTIPPNLINWKYDDILNFSLTPQGRFSFIKIKEKSKSKAVMIDMASRKCL